jgi:hypothetical protein
MALFILVHVFEHCSILVRSTVIIIQITHSQQR